MKKRQIAVHRKCFATKEKARESLVIPGSSKTPTAPCFPLFVLQNADEDVQSTSNVTWQRSESLPAISTAVVHAHGAGIKLATRTVIIIRSGRNTGNGNLALAV